MISWQINFMKIPVYEKLFNKLLIWKRFIKKLISYEKFPIQTGL